MKKPVTAMPRAYAVTTSYGHYVVVLEEARPESDGQYVRLYCRLYRDRRWWDGGWFRVGKDRRIRWVVRRVAQWADARDARLRRIGRNESPSSTG
ncbi:hypothetical protein Sulac_0048 [Sulfobacillus acidophilus DSM 10332]|uniref:Uncharacterized protein n=1 Tax=Sulfobacillus acidophilus (strain ATCC 700253 / DSM 10332 / NAL) TaxID=679936 RepID=G8TV41_SULAD|nr:hypothetical protein Sulac_0048 [Sulfobacillus acidophilus DSM 10332]